MIFTCHRCPATADSDFLPLHWKPFHVYDRGQLGQTVVTVRRYLCRTHAEERGKRIESAKDKNTLRRCARKEVDPRQTTFTDLFTDNAQERTAMAYKTMGGQASAGDSDQWKPGEGEFIEGRYLGIARAKGQNGTFSIHKVRVDGDKTWGLSGTVLNSGFEDVPVGGKVRVTYLGMEPSKSGRSYKNFQVEYDPDAGVDATAKASIHGDDQLPFA